MSGSARGAEAHSARIRKTITNKSVRACGELGIAYARMSGPERDVVRLNDPEAKTAMDGSFGIPPLIPGTRLSWRH
jgi:hypothetical protein